jgi:HlyB family type I secretion system ABC transporter
MVANRLAKTGWYQIKRFFTGRRVPFVPQLTHSECGAACLAMLMSYHGRKTRTSELRNACAVGRDGISATTIIRAARSFGFRSEGYYAEPSDLRKLPLPAIIHWKFNHFVVLESCSTMKLEIVDPEAGRRVVNADEFDRNYTGVILTLQADPNVSTEHNPTSALSLWTYFARIIIRRKTVPLILQVLGASLLLQALGLVVPAFTKLIVDDAFSIHGLGLLNLIGLAAIALVAAQATASYVRSLCLVHLRGQLDIKAMPGFVEHLFSLPLQFFNLRPSGDLLLRLSSNGLLRETVTNHSISLILDGTFFFVYTIILVVWAPKIFSLVVIGFAFTQIAILVLSWSRIHQIARQELEATSVEQSFLIEAVKGISLLKASGVEKRAFDRWSNLFSVRLSLSLTQSRFSALIDTLVTGLRLLALTLLLWIGASLVINGKITMGSMLAIEALAISFFAPLSALMAGVQQLQIAGAHLERISDVLEADREQGPKEGIEVPNIRSHIEVRGLDFRYAPDSSLILSNISLRIDRGQKIAIVGHTGSGKSTLAMLLLGLYIPDHGQILFDGMQMSELNYQSIRQRFGVVLQESVLFSGSIRRNIAFSNPSASLLDIITAAKQAAIHDEISGLPMGYETILSEGGGNLSGGQRQRLAIARALLSKPDVLLLDEATSHLDTVTEENVYHSLSRLDCTRIVIAHRLSTICDADMIVVLKAGEIVEKGTHDELMLLNGYYSELILKQMAGIARKRDDRC